MSRIVSLTADLMFSSNIEATLRRAGHTVTTAEDLTALETALEADDTSLVVLDLHAGFDAADVVALAAGRVSGSGVQHDSVPVVAYGRHTEPALLRHAREVGCAESVARSTFVEQMVALVDRNAKR